MKKFFYSFILCTFVALAFTACKPDPLIKGSYEFYKPIMDWKCSEADLRAKMDAMEGWSEVPENESESENEKELCYIHNKTNADIRYNFEDDKLCGTTITYFSCNEKFDQMKNDWTNELNLNWTTNEYNGIIYYSAECESMQCSVSTMSTNNSGLDYMYISFEYSDFFFK